MTTRCKSFLILLVSVTGLMLCTTFGMASGQLDPLFGSGGKVLLPVSGGSSGISGLALRFGRIVVAGDINTGGSDFAVAQFLPNGQLNHGFGGGTGIVATDFFGSYDRASGVAIQRNRRIVAVGAVTHGTTYDIGIARYMPNGNLDSSFASSGKFVFGSSTDDDFATAVLIQPNGKILVCGYTGPVFSEDFLVLRLNSNGTLDTSFGNQGVVQVDFGGSQDIAVDLALQSDGKIVVAGASHQTSTLHDYALLRLTPAGILDASFGNGGKVTTDFGDIDEALSVKLQPDGRIVVSGTGAADSTEEDLTMARYLTNGTLDPTFGVNGLVITNITGNDYSPDFAIQRDGSFVVGAVTNYGDFVVLRYLPDGSIDSTFGSSGIVVTDFAGDLDLVRSVKIQTNGKIVAAGVAGLDFALARYIP